MICTLNMPLLVLPLIGFLVIRYAAQWPSLNYNQTSLTSFLNGGSYSIDLPAGSSVVRVIVLHTNYWSISNLYTTNDEDPGGVFAFLQSELKKAQNDGVKVYILGHISPGIDHFASQNLWQPRFVPKYLSITLPYVGTTIKAQFFGHEHVALFRLYGNLSIYPLDITYDVTPIILHSSISPIYLNYPSFREYSYDRDSFELIDFSDWYLDFSNATNPIWQLQSASVKQHYDLSRIDSNSICGFVKRMYNNNSALLDYLENSYSYSPDYVTCTDKICEIKALCDAQFLVMDDFNNCVNKGIRLLCAEDSTTTTTATTTTSTSGGNNNPNTGYFKWAILAGGVIFLLLLTGTIFFIL